MLPLHPHGSSLVAQSRANRAASRRSSAVVLAAAAGASSGSAVSSPVCRAHVASFYGRSTARRSQSSRGQLSCTCGRLMTLIIGATRFRPRAGFDLRADSAHGGPPQGCVREILRALHHAPDVTGRETPMRSSSRAGTRKIVSVSGRQAMLFYYRRAGLTPELTLPPVHRVVSALGSPAPPLTLSTPGAKQGPAVRHRGPLSG